mmetsp:Transcript_22228/g.41683  ORF Transcript_22228/g.41683 Transcript_22228/m.41683 type:complete len:84 (-) Transcript_22228:147-398(-)
MHLEVYTVPIQGIRLPRLQRIVHLRILREKARNPAERTSATERGKVNLLLLPKYTSMRAAPCNLEAPRALANVPPPPTTTQFS